MTEAEALSELKSFPVNCLDFKEQMALDMAINALEKQIAKKCDVTYRNVMREGSFRPLEIKVYKCPICHSETGTYGTGAYYCIKCGQKLDWNEV